MGIPANYFRNLYKTQSINNNNGKVEINIDLERLGIKLDMAQAALDTQVWNDIKKYMPHDEGILIELTNAENMQTHGEVYATPPNSDYGHYMYMGEVYVDPEYKIGAFYDPLYGFWSRPGIEKIPGGREIQYTQPQAHKKWAEYAYNQHKEEWVNVVKNVMGRN